VRDSKLKPTTKPSLARIRAEIKHGRSTGSIFFGKPKDNI
jgi:hypothetical protein